MLRDLCGVGCKAFGPIQAWMITLVATMAAGEWGMRPKNVSNGDLIGTYLNEIVSHQLWWQVRSAIKMRLCGRPGRLSGARGPIRSLPWSCAPLVKRMRLPWSGADVMVIHGGASRPMRLRNRSNLSLHRALVRPSATCWPVGTYSRATLPAVTCSLT